MKDLKTKVEIILKEEQRIYSLRGKLGSFNIDLFDGWRREGEVPALIVDNPSKDLIKSPNVDLLIKLYIASEKEKREIFKRILLEFLTPDYWQSAHVIFFVLYRIGLLIPATEKAKSLTGNYAINTLFGLLSKIIYFEYSFISEEEYEKLKQTIKDEGHLPYVRSIMERINAVELRIIERELEGFNQEVNEDKEKVMSIWQDKFKTKNVPAVIKDIEEDFISGEFNENKYATSIDRVRVLIGEVTRELAIEASKAKGDSKIDRKTKEHEVFEYLKEIQFLDLKEYNLLKAIYGMASDKGSHQITALREHARLVKNMTYEFLLLMLSK